MATSKSSYIGLRLDAELLQRIDALAARQVVAPSRSEVVRAAIAAGLDVLERAGRSRGKARPRRKG